MPADLNAAWVSIGSRPASIIPGRFTSAVNGGSRSTPGARVDGFQFSMDASLLKGTENAGIRTPFLFSVRQLSLLYNKRQKILNFIGPKYIKKNRGEFLRRRSGKGFTEIQLQNAPLAASGRAGRFIPDAAGTRAAPSPATGCRRSAGCAGCSSWLYSQLARRNTSFPGRRSIL